MTRTATASNLTNVTDLSDLAFEKWLNHKATGEKVDSSGLTRAEYRELCDVLNPQDRGVTWMANGCHATR